MNKIWWIFELNSNQSQFDLKIKSEEKWAEIDWNSKGACKAISNETQMEFDDSQMYLKCISNVSQMKPIWMIMKPKMILKYNSSETQMEVKES